MNRATPTPKTQEFTRRLLAYEADAGDPSGVDIPPAVRVSEKLRRSLSTLTGATAFRFLLARALTLAKREAHSLSAVQVKPDGSLEGLSELNGNEAHEAGVMLIAHLLGLLVAFIGVPPTLRLVRDAWPDLPFDNSNSGETQLL